MIVPVVTVIVDMSKNNVEPWHTISTKLLNKRGVVATVFNIILSYINKQDL